MFRLVIMTEGQLRRRLREARGNERRGIKNDLEYFADNTPALHHLEGSYPRWVGHGALSTAQIHKAINYREAHDPKED